MSLGSPFADDGSLDPRDWDAFRDLAHGVLDTAIDYLQDVRERPAWVNPPEFMRKAFSQALPTDGVGTAQACREALAWILPYATGNIHPRFFGWVHGTGTAGGLLAALLTAAMNANVGGRQQGAIYVERQVLRWCQEIFRMPEDASGLLVSGTSMATLIGLAVARNTITGADVRREGVAAAGPVRLYTSAEAHVSVTKAAEMLGLGSSAVRLVRADKDFRMDVATLAKMVTDDRRAGCTPLCVVGTAGTVNTGAIDDLQGIADVCRRGKLWFHVDGAFGAALQLSEKLAPRLRGIEAADSLAFDFHKWLHVQYDAGCILVRRGAAHLEAFATHANYLARQPRGAAGGQPWFCDFGPELSREFRALRVWFTLREVGLQRLAAKVEENCAQAQWLARRIKAEPALELCAPVTLNIVCLRYCAPGLSRAALDRLNEELVAELHESGIAVPSSTRIHGAPALRVAITNHRTRETDLAIFIEGVLSLGARLAGQLTAGSRSAAG